MSPSTENLKAQVKDGIGQLQTLRDEVRVRLHLAGMDAKDAWNSLEPEIEHAEHLAKDATDASRAAIEDVLTKTRDFLKSLSKPA
jgi:hypothetical protein